METQAATKIDEQNAAPEPPKQEQNKRKNNFSRKRTKNKVGNKPHQPNRKSTSIEETPFINDPLWKESFLIDGETGFFVNELRCREFNADAAVYVHLVDQEYKAIADADKYYAMSIPSSAHAYYHMVLYWYEVALIACKRGTASNDQCRLVRFIAGYPSAVIAAGAGEYLEGLGDFRDFTGVNLLRAREPNDKGHFGRATAHTHGFYETLPAPAIFYQRVVEDLKASEQGGQPDDRWMIGDIMPNGWQTVPEVLEEAAQRRKRAIARIAEEEGFEDEGEGGNAPIEEPEVIPATAPPHILLTVNLLGWRCSKTLNANQLGEIQGVIDPDNVWEGLVNRRYCLRRELFELVERRLKECKRYKMTPIPTTTGGSMVQHVGITNLSVNVIPWYTDTTSGT